MVDSKSYLKRGLQGAAVAALVGNAGVASALGFGAIRVHSALNEPLNATINLVALTPDEKSALQVEMASVDMFRRFGIERTALADRIRIVSSPGNESSQVLLRLTTDGPVREPFLRFLIEADTGSGRALREYTVLLDPPGRAPATPAPTSRTTATATQAPQPSRRGSNSSAGTASPASPAAATARQGNTPQPDRYGPVQAGETLSRIAAGLRRAGTTLDQVQVAIYRNNPQAFNDNMNILLRGAVLAIPPIERIRAIEPSEARTVVRGEQAEFMAQIARTTPDAAADGTGAEGEAAPTTTDARLRLEPPRADGEAISAAVGTAGFGRLAIPDFGGTENNESTAALEGADGASGAAAEPDPMVSQGAEAPAGGETATPQAQPADQAVDAPVDTPTPSAVPAEDSAAATPADETGGSSDDSLDATAGVRNTPADSAPVAQATGAEQADDTAVTQPVATDEPVSAAVDSADAEAQSGDAYQPLPSGDIDVVGSRDSGSLLRPRNLLLFAGGLSLVALLLAWRRRRQYKPVPLHFETQGDHPVPPSAEDEFEQPVETRQQAHIAPVPETKRTSQRIEQAEAQIKAGDFDQARDTLEVGLAERPDDSALQDKLLELDYLAGDDNAFMAHIDRFGPALTDNGVRWAGVASMGRVLRPQDARFAIALQDDDRARPTEDDDRAPTNAESAEALYESFVSSAGSSLDEELPSAVNNDDTSDDAAYFTIDESLPDTAETQAPPADLELPQDSAESAGDHHDDGFEWQDQEVVGGDERQHDQGDEPGLSFDLDSPTEAPPAGKPARSVETIDTAGFDLDDGESAADDDDTDPVEIRIDLARMYIEMEDESAARELLEDVQKEGNETQRATAEELLNKL